MATCSDIHHPAHRPLPVWWGFCRALNKGREGSTYHPVSPELTKAALHRHYVDTIIQHHCRCCFLHRLLSSPVSVTLLWPLSPHICALVGPLHDFNYCGWPAVHPGAECLAAAVPLYIMGSDLPLSPPITELSICPTPLALPGYCVDAATDVSLALLHFIQISLPVSRTPKWNP